MKLTAEIYKNLTVLDAIRAADYHRDRGLRDGDNAHYTVWVHPETLKTFVRNQTDVLWSDGCQPVYDTEEGRFFK